MDEGMDMAATDAVEVSGTDAADIPASIEAIEPADAAGGDPEVPISAREMADLQREADALELPPLEEAGDGGIASERPGDPSTLELAAVVAMANRDSPGIGANVIGSAMNRLAGGAPDTGAAFSQLARMGLDAVPVAMNGLMEAAHRQNDLPGVKREDYFVDETGAPIHDKDGNLALIRPAK